MLFALGTSALWGTSAFVAGVTSRRLSALTVVFCSQAVSLAVLLTAVAIWAAQPTASDVGWGAAAGVGTAVALWSFYQGLAVGRMSVVAPLTAVISVVTPALVDAVRGVTPTLPMAGGLVLALVAIVLLSAQQDDEAVAQRLGVGYAVVAGLGFSLFLVAISQAATTAGAWPLLGSRFVSVPLLGLALLVAVKHPRPRVQRGDWWPLAAIGAIDVSGAGLYMLAVARTSLTTAVVLSSLYPLVTVLWARLLLRELLGLRRSAGVAASLVAITLILSG